MRLVNINWPMVAFAIGLALIVVVPDQMQRPVLLYVNQEHAVKLVDAIGLALLLPALVQFNVRLVRIVRAQE